MKTLSEIKNEVAKETFKCSFKKALVFMQPHAVDKFMVIVAKRYAEEALKEAAEIPACYTSISETLEIREKIRNLIKEVK